MFSLAAEAPTLWPAACLAATLAALAATRWAEDPPCGQSVTGGSCGSPRPRRSVVIRALGSDGSRDAEAVAPGHGTRTAVPPGSVAALIGTNTAVPSRRDSTLHITIARMIQTAARTFGHSMPTQPR